MACTFDFNDVKALIFDYGGTLDTDGRHWSHVLRDGYAEAGVDLTYEQWRDAYVYGERNVAINSGDNFHDVLLKKVEKEFEYIESNDIICFTPAERHLRIVQIADYCYAYASKHINVSREVLTTLSAKYPMALVSNFYGNIHAVLDDFQLNFFQTIIESAVVKLRKPDPAIFRIGVDALGCDPASVLVVGDSYSKDILPASSLGCPTVWIRGEGWGCEPEDTSAPRKIITCIRQLVPLLS